LYLYEVKQRENAFTFAAHLTQPCKKIMLGNHVVAAQLAQRYIRVSLSLRRFFQCCNISRKANR